MLFQRIKKNRGKAKVSFHEIFRIFRAVDTGKIEYKIRIFTVLVQLLRRAVYLILIDFVNLNSRPCTVLPVPYVFQVVAKGCSDHPPRTRNQYSHLHTSSTFSAAGSVYFFQSLSTILPLCESFAKVTLYDCQSGYSQSASLLAHNLYHE